MSISVMTEVWKDAPVAGTELLLLLALADSANDDRECWPSLAHLQHKVRVSRPQLKRLLAQLINAGLIEKQVKGGKGAKGRESNLYRILSWTGIAGEPGQGSQANPVDAGTGIVGEPLIRHSDSSENPVAPDGAAQPSKAKPKADRPRDLVFDAVALGSFGLRQVKGDKTTAARIAKVSNWLKQQENVTAERVAQFYEWYAEETEQASPPRDVSKFAVWWAKFDDRDTAGDDPYAKMFSDDNLVQVPK